MIDLRLIVELTSRCQLKCLHCLVADQDRSDSLPVDLYDSILQQVSCYGMRKLGLTGGEPCLHPQFDDILEVTSRRGLTYTLATNGWNFSKVLPLLLRYRQALDAVTFSLDGAREETHDHLRGVGSYRRVLESMEACNKEQIPFQAQMVVTSHNYTELEEMCNLAREKGIRVLRFLALMPTPQSARNGLDLPPERYVELSNEVAKIAPNYRPDLLVMMAPGSHPAMFWIPCEPLTSQYFTIDPRGNLALCGNLAGYSGGTSNTEVAGNLREMSFYDAHRRLIEKITKFQLDRIAALERGDLTETDAYFPCWFCARYFGKTEWLKEYPEHPWNKLADKVASCAAVA